MTNPLMFLSEQENQVSDTDNEQLTSNPIDRAMKQLEEFVLALESERAKAEELAQIPEDIPRFVTRYDV